MRVGEQLDLHVARPLDEPLEQEPVVAERGAPPRAEPRPAPPAARRPPDDAHPPPAAAGARLDEQRVPDLGGRANEVLVCCHVTVVAR